MIRKLGVLFAFLNLCFSAQASHIRAGEVIARRVPGFPLSYKFTFFGYRDIEGVPFGNGVFDFGDGNKWGDDDGENIPWDIDLIEDLGNGVERWQFTLSYEYAGFNNYLVSYQEDFRNADIQNISGSATTTFYVETLVVLDPLIPNNSPFFTIPPIDQAAVGAVFEHDPGAIDPDDDSLSYFFVTPKQDLNLSVNGYRVLNDPAFYENFRRGNSTSDGEPTLAISTFGTITWDAPGGATIPPLENREFNVAFIVEEWRKINGTYFRLGYVTRDMQIIVWNVDNEPPEMEIPEDTCVIAGATITGTVTATDQDGDRIRLEAFGGPFETLPTAAFSPNPPIFQNQPASLEFSWETSCILVKRRPYEVKFKATDDPIVALGNGQIINPTGQVKFETWNITVVGPPPTGLLAERQEGRKINLTWDSYTCQNADSMQVWRRLGEFELTPHCETGIPDNAGYQKIASVGIRETSFLDDNNGLGLAPGAKYCYRLVAVFPEPSGGESIVSDEYCDSLLIDVPLITNVDIKKTDVSDGVVEVRWVPPSQIDTVAFKPPYTYRIQRSVGGMDGPFEAFDVGLDTFFVDSNVNTQDEIFTYRILFFSKNDTAPIDSSPFATSVRLMPSPQVGGIRVSWAADVPWSNNVQKFPYHLIFRNQFPDSRIPSDSLVLIDSVNVTIDGFTYFDDGIGNEGELDEEETYCYFVTTRGSYSNKLLPEPLINSSQIICAQPNDTIPPCTPLNVAFFPEFSCENQVARLPCGVNGFQNIFFWDIDMNPACGSDLSFFRIYFSDTGLGNSYRVIGETTDNQFIHDDLSSLAGCYFITAVDLFDNESQSSDIFCNDNCPQYGLPNVITPNNDGKNDVFKPLETRDDCPRFVQSVIFKVFNRAGVELFSLNSQEPEKSIDILWDGKNSSGQNLPAGVYFYSAEVEYITLKPDDSREVIRGWIQIIR